MSVARRVNARDIAQAGGLDKLIDRLIDDVRGGTMDQKERASMFLRALTEQPKGLDGPQEFENVVLLARAGAIPPLVQLVEKGSPVAQAHACAALAVAANGRPEYQDAIVEAGGVEPISMALRAGDAGLQEHAAAAIASVSQSSASQKSLIKAGGIMPLVSLLRGASADTHVHSSQALANLAKGNLEGQVGIARAGALPLLVGLLGSGKAQEAAAHALARLAQDNEPIQAEITQLGGIPKLIALLSVVNIEVQAQAAAALASLASGDSRHEQDVIAKAGGIRPLLALVDSRYPSAQRSAVNALAMLSLHHRENQDSIAAMGGIMPLIMLTQHGEGYSADVQAQAVLALTEISRNNRDNQSAVADGGAISSLVSLLRHSNSSVVEAEVAGAMWALSENHEENKVSIASAGAIPALMTQLASQIERANTNAANAVSSLASNNSANQAEVASLLVGLLEEGSLATQDRAAKALWRVVSENPGNELVIAKAGGAEPLVRLLQTKHPASKAYALWSLSLSIDAENQKVVADTGAIKPLVNLLSSKDARVYEQAACALKLLATKNKETQIAIARQGAILPLISLLDGEGADRSQEYAAAALAELAMIPANKTAIDRGGGIQPLVALLSDSEGQPASKQYAAAALARLSAEERRQRNQRRQDRDRQQREDLKPKVSKAEVIADAGAIAPLVDLLSGVKGPEAQEEAAGALLALAENEGNRMTITESGGIGPLVLLLGCPNEKAREHAEGALVRLSIESTNRVIIIRKLVGMLDQDRGTSAQEQAAAALANLARESTENRTSILEAGGVPRLLALLHSNSAKAKENAVSAISKLAYKSASNQAAIDDADGIPILVSTLLSASLNVKELSGVKLCELTAEAIWNMADGNKANQTKLMKEGAIPPIVGLVTNPIPEMQTNAAGALACLSKDHPENQAAIARSGAIPPLCTNVRDGTPETREESAAALWALATDNAPNKATVAKLGGIEPLVSMLMYGSTEKSSMNAAGALAALATQHSDNRLTITKRMVGVLGGKAPPARAVRLLSALASLCDNEATNQIAIAKSGGIQHLITWLGNASEEVQVQAAKAMLAVAGNNSTTQATIGKLGGILPLVSLTKNSVLEAQEHAASALWHLASLSENRVLIHSCNGIPPLVGMLVSDGDLAPRISAMTLLRLAEGSSKAASAIAQAGGIKPLAKLLVGASSATLQVAAATLAAVGLVSRHRDEIANVGAIKPLIRLLTDKSLGTPETAARALAQLAREDGDDAEVREEAAEDDGADAGTDGAVGHPETNSEVNLPEDADDAADDSDVDDASDDDAFSNRIGGAEMRRICIKQAGGVRALVSMLDGSNLNPVEPFKPATVGGWGAVRVGLVGCIEMAEIFPGSEVDLGMRIGMQEQAAATLSHMACGDIEIQDAIVQDDGVLPLLSLIRSGTQLAQEYAASTVWYLATTLENQKVIVSNNAITDLVALLKGGSPTAQYFSAAALAELAQGAILQRQTLDGTFKRDSKARRGPGVASRSKGLHEEQSALEESNNEAQPAADEVPPAEVAVPRGSFVQDYDVLLAILDAGGIPALVKLCESGTPEGKEKAACAMWHLALDNDNQFALASNGGIKPLVSLLAEGNDTARKHASDAMTRLATDNPENQAQIAKRLVGLLDHDDASVVSRAAHDLQALAQEHQGAPMVIVNAGAISPLVTVLSNGKTDEGRNEAAKTLHTLANSGPANQVAIAVGLVALLGVGTDQAQEYVTELLLRLSSGLDSDLDNRTAIANAGPFRMLVQQLRSDSVRVRMLAAAVMSRLSGDSEENVEEIAKANGIQPLVALLDSDDMETQSYATTVLAHMTGRCQDHAMGVAHEGGTPLLVALLTSDHTIDAKAQAANALGSIALQNAIQVGKEGAIDPLVGLLKTDSKAAKQAAALALANIAAGGKENQDTITANGGIELLVNQLDADELVEIVRDQRAPMFVQSNAAKALAELARDHMGNQRTIASVGGIDPLVGLVNESINDQCKEEAAGALWCLSSGNHQNQQVIADAGGMESLVELVGKTTARGQQQAVGALASLALNNRENQSNIAELLVELLEGSDALSDTQEKAARAISCFADSDPSNQDALAEAGCVPLIVSLLQPRRYELPSTTKAAVKVDKDTEDGEDDEEQEDDIHTGEHHLTQRELSSALWRLASNNPMIQTAIASEGGVQLLIALLSDHPDIHREAAGALWSLAADVDNQRLIADHNGIPKLVDLLKYGAKNVAAQETATGALRRLAARAENRILIADAGGITNLIPLFDGATTETKAEVENALLALAIENPSNQFSIANKLVAMLANGPEDAQEALTSAQQSKVEAQEHATQVLLAMSFERDNRDAISRTGAVTQLVRQLKAGSEKAQTMASNALSNIVRMSADLRIQVTQQLVTLLGSTNEDVRQRAGSALRDNSAAEGGEDKKFQREAAMYGGVGPLVELLKAGLDDDRVEAQEYALWSLSMISDPARRRNMVEKGCIPCLIQSLSGGKLSGDSQEHAIQVLSCLCLDAENHEQIINQHGIKQMVVLLSGDDKTLGAKRQAAIGLARLAIANRETQMRIASGGAIKPLIQWLDGCEGGGPPDVAARALADIGRDNAEQQQRIVEDGAIPPLVMMLRTGCDVEGFIAASGALATLAHNMLANQAAIAEAGGIPPLIQLLLNDVSDCQMNAACALAMLADDENNKMLIFRAGGIAPLVALLHTGSEETQKYAARALESLAQNVQEIQTTLAHEGATKPLTQLLGSDSAETQDSAMAALLCLASHPDSRVNVIRRLVGVLLDRNTAAQLKAAEALAILSSRTASNRSTIVHAGAIAPLVGLLGNGQRADRFTPPERAAAVLADLSRISESKVEIADAGGIQPLVHMLSSTCEDSQTHAACALRYLSVSVDNKVAITTNGGIPRFVALLSSGTLDAQRHAAHALYQVATSAENKSAIVAAGGIAPLVSLMLTGESEAGDDTTAEEEQCDEAVDATDEAQALDALAQAAAAAKLVARNTAEMKESAAAVLSELARSQSTNRLAIVQEGGIGPLVDLVCSGSTGAQKHATCALWGLTQDARFRSAVVDTGCAVERLVELLRDFEGETQGFAAATLVCLAHDERGKEAILKVGGPGPLMTIALGPANWLRSQCIDVLKLLGYPDPTESRDTSNPPLSPRFMRYQAELAANPAVWMVSDEPMKPQINDEHMADLARKVEVGTRVIVELGNRKGEVRYVGKIPEIAPGYWIGVRYDEPVGKNNGSIKGRRCFECDADFGGFLRPNHIRVDPDPPKGKTRADTDSKEADNQVQNNLTSLNEGVTKQQRRRRGDTTSRLQDEPLGQAVAKAQPPEEFDSTLDVAQAQAESAKQSSTPRAKRPPPKSKHSKQAATPRADLFDIQIDSHTTVRHKGMGIARSSISPGSPRLTSPSISATPRSARNSTSASITPRSVVQDPFGTARRHKQ